MGQPLGLWEMRCVMVVTAVTTALCVIVVIYCWNLEFVPLPVIYVLASAYGVSAVLYLIFTGLVVRAFCTLLRLLKEMNKAGYISKEAWAAAVSLGQLQIGGLLASTTSTALSAGGISFGSALKLARHDESGRDMFKYVAIPLWLDIIANSTCVLFLSGAVHMPNAVLGNALARQRNRAAVPGNSESVVDRKWHAKVSELAERGFTLESLLSFYKRLGTDYMLHYKPDVHRTSDVVRQAIIPLSRPSGVAYAVTMMEGACSLPDAIVTHNWGNLFRDLVAGICADALGLPEYALVSELLDRDVVALESMLANSGKIQKTYWVCAFCIAQHSCICQTISAGDVDPVHGTEHPTCDVVAIDMICFFLLLVIVVICCCFVLFICILSPKCIEGDCGRPKSFNNTPEVDASGLVFRLTFVLVVFLFCCFMLQHNKKTDVFLYCKCVLLLLCLFIFFGRWKQLSGFGSKCPLRAQQV
ncbi:unnamed protein product [Polarella glacialis]|uniref:Uncharacterized protein n=1 Tax=Polarella glacialis TaxID=89957 RepID=A0A813KTJ3_POLGL|nr:unnamed protein product [Polarella glacialis]